MHVQNYLGKAYGSFARRVFLHFRFRLVEKQTYTVKYSMSKLPSMDLGQGRMMCILAKHTPLDGIKPTPASRHERNGHHCDELVAVAVAGPGWTA